MNREEGEWKKESVFKSRQIKTKATDEKRSQNERRADKLKGNEADFLSAS